jgi:hypothetical protein
LIQSITLTGDDGDVEIQTTYQKLLIFRVSKPLPILRYLKVLFENLALPGDEPVTVVTRWQDVPIAHFANLPAEMDEAGFREVFGEYLPEGTDVVRLDERDGHSRFHCIVPIGEDVWEVIDTLSYGTVSDEEIRVSHFIPYDDLTSIQPWNLKISGVHKSLTLAELTSIFSEFGRILSVGTKPLDDDKVVVSLQYINEADFRHASQEIPRLHQGLAIVTPRSEHGFAVYNFKAGVTEEEVRMVFEGADNIRIDASKERGQRPVVWLGYRSADDCEEAMEEGENHFSGGCRLMCVPKSLERDDAFALLNQKARSFQTVNTIYIASLPKAMTKEKLIGACREFGDLNSCVVISTGRGTFGVVAFATPQGYQAARTTGLNLGYKTRTRVTEYRARA